MGTDRDRRAAPGRLRIELTARRLAGPRAAAERKRAGALDGLLGDLAARRISRVIVVAPVRRAAADAFGQAQSAHGDRRG
jgi:hypothetical protein